MRKQKNYMKLTSTNEYAKLSRILGTSLRGGVTQIKVDYVITRTIRRR